MSHIDQTIEIIWVIFHKLIENFSSFFKISYKIKLTSVQQTQHRWYLRHLNWIHLFKGYLFLSLKLSSKFIFIKLSVISYPQNLNNQFLHWMLLHMGHPCWNFFSVGQKCYERVIHLQVRIKCSLSSKLPYFKYF